MSLLAVDQAKGGYGVADEVLKGVSLLVSPGEIVSIIGPNGAGKSTLLKAVAGLVPLRSGSIRLKDRDITREPSIQRGRHGLVFVPQERNVFGTLTVAENLEMGAYIEPKGARARMHEMYDQFPLLAEKRRRPARTLSGGQRQVLAMAIGLMGRPQLLLLDEPTAGLSPKAAEQLFETVLAINRNGVAILLVEQNALEALAISTRAYVLVAGRNSREGQAQALAGDAEIRRLFLGG